MTTNRIEWLRQTAEHLRSGKFDLNAVTEEWQRKALLRACPTDGSELHEAYPSKLLEQADEIEEDVLVYWRRTGSPAFPVESVSSVEVVTPEEYADEYGGTPGLGTSDGAWHAVNGDSDGIDESIGLCGDLSEIHLLCDAMHISAAIHQHLGLTLAAWGEDCMWKKGQLDSHGVEDADYYFRTIGKLYGADAEAAARRQYAKE